MSMSITNRISLCSIVALSFLGVAANECLAQGSDCIDNGTFNVCVEWSQGDPPQEGTDYAVEFHGTDAPDLALLKGDSGWIVYCEEETSHGTPADIGVFTTPGGDADYTVKIKNGAAAGFKSVGSASLVPINDKTSSIAAGSVISGNISGALKVVAAGSTGGEVGGLIVLGDVTGPIDARLVSAGFLILGDVTKAITFEEINGGWFKVRNASDNITVSGKIFEGTLTVNGTFPINKTVRIGELEGTAMGTAAIARFDGAFNGTLQLDKGLADPETVVRFANLGSNGTVDLTNDNVAGCLVFIDADGDIINGGALSGDWYPSETSAHDFTGTATFSSVTSTGTIETASGADISGVININGDFSGAAEITGTFSGDLDISGDVTGDIQIDEDMTGSITIDGALANALTGGGRILVAGESSGAIKVGKQTESLTLIQVVGGLATGATIEINTTEGFFDAVGDIHIGGTTPVALPFEGCIRIYDKILASVNGHLKGAIDVVGCHGDGDVLIICIDGSDNGNVTLDQTGCIPANATWGCEDPPDCP